MERKACIDSLPNNSRLNRVLKVEGVAYGPRPIPVSMKVLKKRKADAAVKVSAKLPKVPEKKGPVCGASSLISNDFRAKAYP
jgi:hypothetical protein